MTKPLTEAGAEGKKTRLQAFLASCGLGSRRACEQFILDRRVSVNGRTASLGESVTDGDVVRFDAHIVRPQSRLRYILLHKPAGYLSSMSDPEGRPLAVDLLKNVVEERVYNVGRLDQWSSGLLLFTNDGALALKMVHPSGTLEKEYEVETDKVIPPEFAGGFESGLEIDGVVYRALSVRILGPKSARIVLIEGKNREIRRVLAHYELRALHLCRIRIGPIVLGNLPEGEWRELRPEEIAALKATPPHGRESGTA